MELRIFTQCSMRALGMGEVMTDVAGLGGTADVKWQKTED